MSGSVSAQLRALLPSQPSPAQPLANFRDLSVVSASYVPATPAEVRAVQVIYAIANLPDAFLVAMNRPNNGADLDHFVAARVRGKTDPTLAREFVEHASALGDKTFDILKRGTATASDKEILDYVADAKTVTVLENKIIDQGGFNIDGLAFRLNNRTDLLVYSAIDEGNRGIIHFNNLTAAPGQDPEVRDARQRIYEDRAKVILDLNPALTPVQRSEAAGNLVKPIFEEINGDLWKYRALNAMVVAGLTTPDQHAVEVFNTVSDEMLTIRQNELQIVMAGKTGAPAIRPLGLAIAQAGFGARSMSRQAIYSR